MKIILATGVPRLNAQIENKFADDVEVVGKPLFREAVDATVNRTQADILLLSDQLEGVTEMDELILQIRARYPKTRVVFIGKDMTQSFKSFLYKLNIFDILPEKFSEAELRNAFFNPKQWEDISEGIEILDGFSQKEEIGTKVEIRDVANIDKHDYTRIKPLVTDKNSTYQEFVSFWSVLDQSGKTFSAVNSALFLASNKDLKILLIDFNIKNPNVHLQFGFSDLDKNLAAMILDMEEGRKINATTLEHYLITHPVYNNLKILPGFILKTDEKDSDFYINVLNLIFKAAQSDNFSTILIDTDSGLDTELSTFILKNSTKILLHMTESPGGLYAVRRMFDPEIGPFVPKLISKKKVFPIINRATEDYHSKFKHATEAILDGNKTVAMIKEDSKVHASIFDSAPILSQPTETYYMTFLKIANVIHPGLFKQPTKKKPEQTTTKSKIGLPFFGGGKKK